ncbi:MAG: HAD family hydrolase [Candidatus Thorarchaeota archaeon]
MEKINNSKAILIIFDLDDTLIKSNINYKEMRKEIINLLKLDNNSNLYTKPISELLKIMEKQKPDKLELAYRKISEIETASIKISEIIKGADKLPDLLDKYNIFYGILTNNTRKTIDQYLLREEFQFLKKFTIFTRSELKEMKPNPEGIHKIIEYFEDKIQKNLKKSTFLIGDSFIDANASYKAKIPFIFFNSRNIDPNLFESKPMAEITSWNQFEKLLIEMTNIIEDKKIYSDISL